MKYCILKAVKPSGNLQMPDFFEFHDGDNPLSVLSKVTFKKPHKTIHWNDAVTYYACGEEIFIVIELVEYTKFVFALHGSGYFRLILKAPIVITGIERPLDAACEAYDYFKADLEKFASYRETQFNPLIHFYDTSLSGYLVIVIG